MSTNLETELQTYESQKKDLLGKSEGKFVLIKGREILGVYDSPEAAYSDGLRRLGNVPMLIKRIMREEPSVWVPALQLGLIHADVHR